MQHQPQIAIIDFGSQYTHLIARRIRGFNVLSRIYLPEELEEREGEKGRRVRGIILSGGPKSVYGKESLDLKTDIFSWGVPVLGICYGQQLLAHKLGGQVKSGKVKEYGLAELKIKRKIGILKGLKAKEQCWMSHGDSVQKLPLDFQILASTKDCPAASIGNPKKNIWAVQFHPEVAHTPSGNKILKNFVFSICGCKNDWRIENFLKEIKQEIRDKVGERKIFLLVSGGVDSTVCFALLNKVLSPKRVKGVHIDTGFMRQSESDKIAVRFNELGFSNLHIERAEKLFFKKLKGVVDPEKKRQIIGRLYIDLKDEISRKMKLNEKDWILAQGTIYPDTIESGGTKHAAKIKTHHNRAPAVQRLLKKGLVIEPIKELYKDEVRELGHLLGLPEYLVNRHPFPGPGLAIRILCSNGRDYVKNKQAEERKLTRLISNYQTGIDSGILPIKSVGVQGDFRTYAHPAVVSGKISMKNLSLLAPAITGSLFSVNRVCKVVWTRKDFRAGKIIPAYLTKKRTRLLQKVDNKVMQIIKQEKIYQDIWQFPIILAPYSLTGAGETIILRPVQSQEAMTVNFYQFSNKVLERISKALQKIEGVDLILYDVTNKPPGTIEWE